MKTPAGLDATARLDIVPDIVPDITADRLAAFEVAAVDELAVMPAEQRIAKLRSMAGGVLTPGPSFLMARDMTAVVDPLLENPRGFGDARLAKAAEEARCSS
jgi:hypothetical protein